MFDAVENALFEAHHTRWVWKLLNGIIGQSGVTTNSTVMGCLSRTYVAYISSFVRREADPRRDSSSLARSLQYLEGNPGCITRSQYIAMAMAQTDADSEADVVGGFNVFSPDGGNQLDGKTLARKRVAVRDAAVNVKQYVDEHVAHRSAAANPGSMLTFGDVDAALDNLETITKELYSLRHPGVALWTGSPVSDLNLLRMFEEPWFPKGSTLPPGLNP